MTQPCSACQKKCVACTFAAVTDPPDNTSIVSKPTPEPASFDDNTWGEIAFLPFAEPFDDFAPDLLQSNSWLDPATIAYGELNFVSTPVVSEQPAITLRFLEGFTRNKGLIDSFDCGTEPQRVLARRAFKSKLESQHPVTLSHDPLRMTCHQLVSLVEEVLTIKPRNSAVTMTWSPVVGALCMEFFSPFHIRLYLELYWALWHSNVNILHRPTFDPTAVKAVLVAAMVIIGASVSPEAADRENAKMWFNAVEEAVFQDNDFCNDVEDPRVSPFAGKLQSLQAAYIVCLFQNWNGTDASKRRIRRFRYGNMIAVSSYSEARALHAALIWTRLQEILALATRGIHHIS
jgi:hypothetical protein